MEFAAKHITHLTLSMLLHYLGKLKILIFYKYSADTEDNPNKLHFECISFNSSTRVTVYVECICVLNQNLDLIAEYHVDC